MPKFNIDIASQAYEPFLITWKEKDYTIQVPTIEFMAKFDAVCQETVEALTSKNGDPDYAKINELTREQLRIATGNGVLVILEIQGESGKRMPTGDFLRGYSLAPGTVLK